MAYIQLIEEKNAKGPIKKIYDAGKARAGQVANIIQVMSLDALTTEAAMQFYIYLMKTKNALTFAQKEMLATVVSNANDCYY